MTLREDVEKAEIEALLEYGGDLSGKRVLEIGSGKGRLTWRYARRTAHVTGLEPDESRIEIARAEVPDDLRGRVTFEPAAIADYRPPADFAGFDVAIMSWSL